MKQVILQCETDPRWIDAVMENFNLFLADHANCERKASAQAMGYLAKYPDRDEILLPLIELAQEELDHFRLVYQIMMERGIPLAKERRDPYIHQFLPALRHGRDARFLDRLVMGSIVETRGAERFSMVARAQDHDLKLQKFYRELTACEARHGDFYLIQARHYFSDEEIASRVKVLALIEADIVKNLEITPMLYA
ncbi:tRNA-(ms[2]io[6]A)-hydroxylase [Magnetococcales bacterium HHB-1]